MLNQQFNLLTLFFIVGIIILFPFYQSSGQCVSNFPAGKILNSVICVDQQIAIITGDNGNLLRTSDAGEHGYQSIGCIPRPYYFNHIGIRSSRLAEVYVPTFDSTVFHSTDAGETWEQIKSTFSILARGYFQFIDSLYGVVVGDSGLIFWTTDGGNSWEHQLSQTKVPLHKVHFIDRNNGTIISHTGLILHTTNHGINWHKVREAQPGWLGDVEMLDSSTIVIVGGYGSFYSDSSLILISTNAGSTWEREMAFPQTVLTGVHFISSTVGIVVGDRGVILKTTNRGLSWSIKHSNWHYPLLDISFAPPSGLNDSVTNRIGFAVGSGYPAQAPGSSRRSGIILRTTDGGETWSRLSYGYAGAYLLDVHFVDRKVGMAVGGDKATLRTTDGGKTWENFTYDDTSLTSNVSERMNAIWMVSDSIAYAVGNGTGRFSYYSVIWKTTNGGKDWTQQWVSWTSYLGLLGISFWDSQLGLIVGEGGSIYRTVDGGTHWQLSTFSNKPLRNITFADSLTAIAVGGGIILHTSSGGMTWDSVYGDTYLDLRSAKFLGNGSVGIAVGSDWRYGPNRNGIILRSTDKGITWNRVITTDSLEQLFDLSFTDSLNGLIVGNNGFVTRTSDGGSTWKKEVSFGKAELRAVSMLDETTSVAVGELLTILRISGKGITTTAVDGHSNLPVKFLLNQNYPNPFNPSTVISYELPTTSDISLTIYNLLGEEIATMVNERKEPGNYNVRWDAGKHPSGIYFYTLVAGNFRETKKLLLLK